MECTQAFSVPATTEWIGRGRGEGEEERGKLWSDAAPSMLRIHIMHIVQYQFS